MNTFSHTTTTSMNVNGSTVNITRTFIRMNGKNVGYVMSGGRFYATNARADRHLEEIKAYVATI